MQVLDLAQEQRSEFRVELDEEVGAFALVHASVISGCVTVKAG